jgi:hypothetical protein
VVVLNINDSICLFDEEIKGQFNVKHEE